MGGSGALGLEPLAPVGPSPCHAFARGARCRAPGVLGVLVPAPGVLLMPLLWFVGSFVVVRWFVCYGSLVRLLLVYSQGWLGALGLEPQAPASPSPGQKPLSCLCFVGFQGFRVSECQAFTGCWAEAFAMPLIRLNHGPFATCLQPGWRRQWIRGARPEAPSTGTPAGGAL